MLAGAVQITEGDLEQVNDPILTFLVPGQIDLRALPELVGTGSRGRSPPHRAVRSGRIGVVQMVRCRPVATGRLQIRGRHTAERHEKRRTHHEKTRVRHWRRRTTVRDGPVDGTEWQFRGYGRCISTSSSLSTTDRRPYATSIDHLGPIAKARALSDRPASRYPQDGV